MIFSMGKETKIINWEQNRISSEDSSLLAIGCHI